MLTVWGKTRVGRCDGMRRRDFVKVGALTLSGLSLADALRAKAVAHAAGNTSNPRSVILYWVDGGPSHLETYDPKPLAPAEFRGPFSSIESNVPGIRVNELMVEHAKVMDHCALLRSVHHDHGDHFAAAHWMLTGYLGSNANSLDPMFPSFGSVITKLQGANREGMPPYVAVPQAATIGLVPG